MSWYSGSSLQLTIICQGQFWETFPNYSMQYFLQHYLTVTHWDTVIQETHVDRGLLENGER